MILSERNLSYGKNATSNMGKKNLAKTLLSICYKNAFISKLILRISEVVVYALKQN